MDQVRNIEILKGVLEERLKELDKNSDHYLKLKKAIKECDKKIKELKKWSLEN